MVVASRVVVVLAGLLTLTGCSAEPPSAAANGATTPPAPVAAAFDPTSCGTITGRVTWVGDVPKGEDFPYQLPRPEGGLDTRFTPNPHDPRVNATNKGLDQAVVFLRGVPPTASRPWDLPGVSVELTGRNIRVRQGSGPLRMVGFVRRGAEVTMQSKEPVFHNLRARGAAFFSLAFPDPDQPLSRTFEKTGLVHLSSGSGLYWASAYLFVDELPYYTITDRDGRFTLDRVPAGDVEVVAWHPNRTYYRQERDPETSAVTRQTWGEPLQGVAKTTVPRNETVDVNLSLRMTGRE